MDKKDKTLELKLEEFKKALDRLKEALELEKDSIARDSAVKRFEFCFELCWKSSKVYLRDEFGEDAFSPKEVFRMLLKNKLVSDEDTELLLKMTNDRNLTAHTYDEKFIQELFDNRLPGYFENMRMVYEILDKR